MYIVRWLMGHPIIATWVLGAIAVLLTLGSFNKETVEYDNAVDTHSKSEEINIDDTNNESIEKNAKLEHQLIKTQAQSKTQSIRADAPVINNAVIINPDKKKISNTSSNSAKPDIKSSATADLGQTTTEEMLLMAREAYWNNGLDEAAQIYAMLIKNEPNVLEYQGELGNVYWRQGYPKKAAKIYSEIAMPMIEEGGIDRVSNMVGFIALFYPDRAADIQKHIQSKNEK